VKEKTPSAQLQELMAKYTPEVRAVAKAALARLRKRMPGAIELVYDNYNALAIGFSPTERASAVVVSIALYPRWVNLFFLHGAKLPDPQKLLRGSGVRVRSIVLTEAALLDTPAVRALITHALAAAPVAMPDHGRRRLLIRAVSAKQRPRRPVG
jgi:hypothetical protein